VAGKALTKQLVKVGAVAGITEIERP